MTIEKELLEFETQLNELSTEELRSRILSAFHTLIVTEAVMNNKLMYSEAALIRYTKRVKNNLKGIGVSKD